MDGVKFRKEGLEVGEVKGNKRASEDQFMWRWTERPTVLLDKFKVYRRQGCVQQKRWKGGLSVWREGEDGGLVAKARTTEE